MKKAATNRLLKTYIIILCIALVGHIVRWMSGQFVPELNVILTLTSFVAVVVSWEFLRYVNLALNRKLPYERSIPVRILIQIAIGIAYAVFLRYLIYVFGEPVLPFTLDRLFLAATWLLYILMSVGINAIFFIQFFIEKWKTSIVETERLEKEKAIVQFDNLKNQLNPHFLFNALTSLNSLIAEDQDLASKFLQHMSRVYRYLLQHKEKSAISLFSELEFIRNYIFLLETRFKNALHIRLNIDAAMEDRLIVPTTVQILIENAIKHNVVDASKPLTIDVLTSGDYLVVSNNLQKRSVVETSNKVGLENLKSLYAYLADNPIEVEQTDDRFYVKVPLL
jgi:two-component system, LytTR family, sensor kinase